MLLTNPHTIRGRPLLKDVERFRNGSFHQFCRLKALITLKEVNISDVEKRKNLHEQNFDNGIKKNKQILVNSTLLFNSLILFLFLWCWILVTNNLIFHTSLVTQARLWPFWSEKGYGLCTLVLNCIGYVFLEEATSSSFGDNTISLSMFTSPVCVS